VRGRPSGTAQRGDDFRFVFPAAGDVADDAVRRAVEPVADRQRALNHVLEQQRWNETARRCKFRLADLHPHQTHAGKVERGRIGDHTVVIVGIALHHRVAFTPARRATGEIHPLRRPAVSARNEGERGVVRFLQMRVAEIRHRFVDEAEDRERRIAHMPGVVTEGRIALRERRAIRRERHHTRAAHHHAVIASAADLQRAAVPAARQIQVEADIGRAGPERLDAACDTAIFAALLIAGRRGGHHCRAFDLHTRSRQGDQFRG
jgi:hypothetical protein